MAEQFTLTLQRREVLGKRVRRLRYQGIIPANVYGRGRPSRAVQMDTQELKRLLTAHAGSRVIQLRIDGAEEPALVRHIEREPRSGRVQHVDFMHVEMTEKLRARVPVRLTGEAPAIRSLGGTLLHLVDALEVECLPRDLPEALDLDVSGMDQLDAVLHVSDISVPPGVTVLADPEETVVKIAPPRLEEEAAPAAAAAEAPAAAPAAAEAEGATEEE
jgi:large subunit ribosomal protein L25